MADAVFLDRDGVINKLVFYPDFGIIDSPMNPSQFRLIDGAAEAISNFNRLGLKVIIVSNQPGIAKGKTTPDLLAKISFKMKRLLEAQGAHIDGEYYCLHHPHAKLIAYRINCDCRKPKAGLLLQAAKDFNLDTSKCYMVGDGLTDVKAGSSVGCKTIFVGERKCDICKLMTEKHAQPDIFASNLLEASHIIEKDVSEKWKYSLTQQI